MSSLETETLSIEHESKSRVSISKESFSFRIEQSKSDVVILKSPSAVVAVIKSIE
jgi:hypothetical protein